MTSNSAPRLAKVVGQAQAWAWSKQAVLHFALDTYRRQGATWEQVAEAIGTTASAARERFSDPFRIV